MRMKLFWKGPAAAALALLVILTGCPTETEDSPSPKEYTVSFDAGDGSGTAPAEKKVKEGAEITLPGKGSLTAPAGKVFDGWKAGGTAYQTGDTYTVTKDITFTAQWKTEEAPAPKEYTVSFETGDGSGTAPAEKKVKEGAEITLPGKGSLTAPAGKAFDGWKAGGTAYQSGDTYTVTKDVTFIAQWKTEGEQPPPPPVNPLVGVWIDWNAETHYKFNADLSYAASTGGVFNTAGSYEIDTTQKRITLSPSGGTSAVYVYAVEKSDLKLTKGGEDTWYTKNPESSGGFNGTQTGGALVGMWQNKSNANDCLAFNGDGEWFQAWYDHENDLVQKNTNGKIWWNVVGKYQYNATTKKLTLEHSDDSTNIAVYDVELPFATQIKLTEEDGTVTTFEKRDDL